jgi:hypothetical protein
MKRLLALIIGVFCLGMFLSTPAQAVPVQLFFDDFGGTLDAKGWTYDHATLSSGDGVSDPAGTPYAEIDSKKHKSSAPQNYTGSMLKAGISTVGYEGIVLSYYWRTANAETVDAFNVFWRVGGSSPGAWNNLSTSLSNSWGLASFSLPSTAENTIVDINFELINNTSVGNNPLPNQDQDYARLDNVKVTGESAVPEPATMALMGMGLAGFLASRKRKISRP